MGCFVGFEQSRAIWWWLWWKGVDLEDPLSENDTDNQDE